VSITPRIGYKDRYNFEKSKLKGQFLKYRKSLLATLKDEMILRFFSECI
jgi:hypothetical protein